MRPPDGSTPRDQESHSRHDPDANWTRTARGTRPFFGYKIHIGVDRGSGLIRSRTVTPAKTYEKRSRREALKARGIKDRIQHRRVRGQPTLPHWQTVRNVLIGRVRAAVERTFSELKRGPYGFVRMRYRGLDRCRLHFDLAAIAYNLRRAAA